MCGGSILSCCPRNPHGHERALKEEEEEDVGKSRGGTAPCSSLPTPMCNVIIVKPGKLMAICKMTKGVITIPAIWKLLLEISHFYLR